MLMNNTSGESDRDPLEVNIDHLKRLLSTVLTIPRNDQEDKVRYQNCQKVTRSFCNFSDWGLS